MTAPDLSTHHSKANRSIRAMLATLRAANSILDRLLAGERLSVAIGDAEDAAWATYAAATASGVLPPFETPR